MHILRVHQKIIFTTLLSFTLTANAEPNNTSGVLLCPSVNAIHQAAPLLNQSEKDKDGNFIVHSGMKPAFHENGISWGLMSTVKASSVEEAIKKSQQISANTSVKFSDRFSYTFYACLYFAPSSDLSENEPLVILAFPFSNDNDTTSLSIKKINIGNITR